MDKRASLLVISLILAITGYLLYSEYLESERADRWELLLNNSSCDSCAARKARVVKKHNASQSKLAE